nr:Unknown Function [uncultured bacterium]
MKTRWFVSHSSHSEDTTPIFFHALQKFDEENKRLEIVWPPHEPIELAARKIELEHCQLVIAEVSMASTGSGIDLGLAYAAKIPVIAFHQGTGVISPIVPSIATSIHVYLTEEHILKVLATLA